MRNCERCGKEMPDTTSICPSCGTNVSFGSAGMVPPTNYNSNPSPSSEYAQGYSPQPDYQSQQPYYNNAPPYDSPSQPGYQSQQSNYGYDASSRGGYQQGQQPYNNPSSGGYQQGQQPYNQFPGSSGGYQAQQPLYNNQGYNAQTPSFQSVSVNVNVGSAPSSINNAALIVEILLNIFTGIYGVGWLMAGETTTGIVLLICSIVLYWPIFILGTIFTAGIGLVCIGPLAIAAIIFNAILLNNTLKRRVF
jgi:hypothetical protein